MNTIIPCNKCTYVNDAAGNGHLECLKYYQKKGCPLTEDPWDEGACETAAEHGHIEILKYLHENGCPWNEDACTGAAENGQLECLQYLHENGCPWDEWACARAAEYGYIEILKYLHENKCPWDEVACTYAKGGDHIDCLNYLHENGCPCKHNRLKLKIYSTKLDIQAEKEDPDIECSICFTNRNKVQFKPCNHTLCIGCSNKIITEDINIKCPFCRGTVKENLLLAN